MVNAMNRQGVMTEMPPMGSIVSLAVPYNDGLVCIGQGKVCDNDIEGKFKVQVTEVIEGFDCIYSNGDFCIGNCLTWEKKFAKVVRMEASTILFSMTNVNAVLNTALKNLQTFSKSYFVFCLCLFTNLQIIGSEISQVFPSVSMMEITGRKSNGNP